MTKTVRILSILAAFVVVILVALPTVFSSEVSEDIKNFLNSPSILEKYKNARSTGSDSAEPPLITQAKAFALYLDPPKPKVKPKPVVKKEAPKRPQTPKPRAPVKPQFDLEGTSYFAEKPELSLALINEPGKGLRWIRQSSQIGHLVIKEVLDGKVVIQDGTRTYEMEPKRPVQKSLIKGEGSSAKSVSAKPQSVTERPQVNVPAERPIHKPPARTISNRTRTVSKRPARPKTPEFTSEQIKMMDEFTKGLEGVDDPEELERQMEAFIKNYDQISNQEAEDIEELGRELSESEEKK